MNEINGTGAGSLEAEIAVEQAFVDSAYQILNKLRRRYRENQRSAEAFKWRNSPQALTERDAFAAHWGDGATRLENVGDRLVFGRLDMTDERIHYIGRIGLRSEVGSQMLIDWRAPAARPFYQATGANPQGVARRRHIQTRLQKVIGIEDEVLDTAHVSENKLVFQGEGALMEALTKARDGHMSDIVATIQAEQDEIIRRTADGLLVIQGGPGTGKTAVALHRAAFLLYAERARLEKSGVLIIGPSPTFLSYIDKVLPSLGETGVVSRTMATLLPGIKAHGRDSETVREIKGRLDWIQICANAARSFERVPADTSLSIASYQVTLFAKDVYAARANARRSGLPHNEAWEGFALELMGKLAAQMHEQNQNMGTNLEWYHDYIRGSLPAQKAINLAWLPMSGIQVLEKLYANPEFLAQCAPMLSAAERKLLWRPRGNPLTESDVPILDELEELLGKLPKRSGSAAEKAHAYEEELARAGEAIAALELGGGIVDARLLAERAAAETEVKTIATRAAQDRQWTYGHIIVDEAQELNPLAWHILLRRCPARSFTVTGDLDQRSTQSRPRTWKEILGPAARALTGEEVLKVSYRTPASVLNRANALMDELGYPAAFPVIAARDIADSYELSITTDLATSLPQIIAAEVKRLDQTVGEGKGRLAILVPSDKVSNWHTELNLDSSLDSRVSLMSALQSKGLEFDYVIVVEPEELIAQNPGDIYVAMTRPTQRLHVVSSRPVPAALEL
ncbi:AAA family ATPase [Gleimia sp. 6138-11-ORH1]|uniref:HelD family protein n=1 Tax=Gleimia sp. 6138-11-ORH1 TaxID=2973937 RepID=UPI0021694A7A|nr:AAA family ATPase [Gleimia sp. 6138-11-ORH1]MCS4484247.1 AAA family ATPase [Gleimia sp. 6138-11-ORH1]